MSQTRGVVIAILQNGEAEVEIERKTACGSACAACGFCGDAAKIVITARNDCGAMTGERVVVHGKTAPLLALTVLTYTMPLVFFFAGYVLSPLLGFAGFVIGLAAAVVYGRWKLPTLKNRNWLTY